MLIHCHSTQTKTIITGKNIKQHNTNRHLINSIISTKKLVTTAQYDNRYGPKAPRSREQHATKIKMTTTAAASNVGHDYLKTVAISETSYFLLGSTCCQFLPILCQ